MQVAQMVRGAPQNGRAPSPWRLSQPGHQHAVPGHRNLARLAAFASCRIRVTLHSRLAPFASRCIRLALHSPHAAPAPRRRSGDSSLFATRCLVYPHSFEQAPTQTPIKDAFCIVNADSL
eukprot:6207835-Pleurochrysis_carterae.AAC.7